MKTLKAFFQVSLISGILMILAGLYLIYTNTFSTGETAGYTGAVHTGTVTGPGTIMLGAIILGVSVFAYVGYKNEKK